MRMCYISLKKVKSQLRRRLFSFATVVAYGGERVKYIISIHDCTSKLKIYITRLWYCFESRIT